MDGRPTQDAHLTATSSPSILELGAMTAPRDQWELDADAMAVGYASHEQARAAQREAEEENGDETYQDELNDELSDGGRKL